MACTKNSAGPRHIQRTWTGLREPWRVSATTTENTSFLMAYTGALSSIIVNQATFYFANNRGTFSSLIFLCLKGHWSIETVHDRCNVKARGIKRSINIGGSSNRTELTT
jgi:hypothetical protein